MLTDTEYTEAYYKEHAADGLDYLVHGYWHASYTDAVTSATLQHAFDDPFVIDAGTACGTILKGFADTGVYSEVLGVDRCLYMVELGRTHFGFSEHQLVHGSLEHLPVPDGRATLVHSGQVLEHVPDELIDAAFAEFFRVLRPGGRMFHNLAALKYGDPPNIHDSDPTHVNVKPTLYWVQKLLKAGFLPDFESYDRFARAPHSPGEGYPSFFMHYADSWTIFAVMKPPDGTGHQMINPKGRQRLNNMAPVEIASVLPQKRQAMRTTVGRPLGTNLSDAVPRLKNSAFVRWLRIGRRSAPFRRCSRLQDLIRAGRAASDRKDWPEAIRLYQQVVETKPPLHRIHVQLGHAYKESGDLDKAWLAYNTARELNPLDDDLYLQIGHLEKLRGRADRAVAAYRKSVELNPRNGNAVIEYFALTLPERVEAIVARGLPERVEAIVARELPERVEAIVARELPERVEAIVARELPERVEAIVARELPGRVEEIIKSRPDRQTIAHNEIDERLRQLLRLVNADSRPNANELWNIAKDIEPIKLNIKFFGYELARQLARALPLRTNLRAHRLGLKSKPSTQVDLESDWAAYWCQELKIPVCFHRKVWELTYALQALYENDMLVAGRRGLGFGCGNESFPSFFAAHGIDVTVTDLPPEDIAREGWAQTGQYAESLIKVFHDHLVDRDAFDRHVTLKHVDMRAIPEDLADYDFCWSICALEHLGSIDAGLDFIVNSLKTLRPGGIAVHTTEFNFLNESTTIDNWGSVLFQPQHFKDLSKRLAAEGHQMAELDFDYGDKPLDKFIDLPPFIHDWPIQQREHWGADHNHLKVATDGIAATCFGLIIRKSDQG